MAHRLFSSRSGLSEANVLFCCPSMDQMAKALVAEMPQSFVRGNIQWGQFEDGWPDLFIKDIDTIRSRDVVFLASFLEHAGMFEQLSVIYALPRYLVRSMTIVLPYFPTGTMERVDEEGQIATAHTLARLLSAAPISIGGPSKLILYDIHALQNRFYFGDAVVPIMLTAFPLILEQLAAAHADEELAIAFPDEGATKRFGKHFHEQYPLITCTKVRVNDKRIVTIKEGEPLGKHVVIIDDLVKTGGTLTECKNLLLEKGAKAVSAFATHAVFPLETWRRFARETSKEDPAKQFQHFYVTDSCPEVANKLRDVPPFRVLSLAPSLAEALVR